MLDNPSELFDTRFASPMLKLQIFALSLAVQAGGAYESIEEIGHVTVSQSEFVTICSGVDGHIKTPQKRRSDGIAPVESCKQMLFALTRTPIRKQRRASITLDCGINLKAFIQGMSPGLTINHRGILKLSAHSQAHEAMIKLCSEFVDYSNFSHICCKMNMPLTSGSVPQSVLTHFMHASSSGNRSSRNHN